MRPMYKLLQVYKLSRDSNDSGPTMYLIDRKKTLTAPWVHNRAIYTGENKTRLM